jgi:hypothetical protein
VNKGVLVVEHFSGSRWSNTILQRFRYEAASGRMRFIGEDHTTVDRTTANGEAVSTNLLNGQQTIDKFYGEEKRKSSTQRRTVRVPKLYLEDVDPDAEQASAWLPKSSLE